MKVTIVITKDNGEVIELSRALGSISSTNVITSIERELGQLKADLLPLVSETLLQEQQALFSLEKEQHNIQKKTD